MGNNPFEGLSREDLEKLAKPTTQDTPARQANADQQAAEAKEALNKKE